MNKLDKVNEKLKFPRDVWEMLIEDVKSGLGKKTICNKYRIKYGYYKYLKSIINGEINE